MYFDNMPIDFIQNFSIGIHMPWYFCRGAQRKVKHVVSIGDVYFRDLNNTRQHTSPHRTPSTISPPRTAQHRPTDRLTNANDDDHANEMQLPEKVGVGA